eukprot:CAMPEP_0119307148 /NCGR_PEP_ID=MMETSP1333-20130426/7721_1 /TAXON_ID=418940 /ORGANISM="Scyphosphaera apsteinii, Strain RCC1455" /LENGTH=758 /DNA_ID=CAMNT_0007310623 /DNA_START=26 /DNA_END=2302 /DNA_ORIENTATION=+
MCAIAISNAARVDIPLFYEQHGWHRTSVASAAAAVQFTISLRQRNIPKLKRLALEVSTPGHASYGRFLSTREIDELTRPSPEARNAISTWLSEAGVHDATFERENVFVSCPVGLASALLETTFSVYKRGSKAIIRASSGYKVPDGIAKNVATIFGLHGIPRPPHLAAPALAPPHRPAKVTPAVLAATYSIGTPYVDRGGKGIQSVAEFQGQYMSDKDLRSFFKAEVPNAQPGDDQVAKYVGVPYRKGDGVEALLDVEFVMGVAPGVKTQFWEWPNMDFCGDLHNYTAAMLAADEPPLSSSISYGWQGDLAELHCKPADLAAVDINWMKLAARGLSIMISSGDSGAGYTIPQCSPTPGEMGKVVTNGTVLASVNATVLGCCNEAHSRGAAGWSWSPHQNVLAKSSLDKNYSFTDSVYHTSYPSADPNFPRRSVYVLNGVLTSYGGNVALRNVNGTISDTTIMFGAEWTPSKGSPQRLRNISMVASGPKNETLNGKAVFIVYPDSIMCVELEFITSSRTYATILVSGPNLPPPPPPGKCTIYSMVAAVGPSSDPHTRTEAKIRKPSLFPSWPASSPWVTAVGATRFIGQVVGGGEMATDQFGSGGGFSKDFTQSDAPWQVAMVAKYVAIGPTLPKFPPKGDFDPMGRATPDVSALGEGYQVWVDGKVQSVGGTSASSPTFASMVSLLNEARFKAGKPQMGFLNPFLYANSDAFFDVVNGTNAFGRGPFTTPLGFACAPGWDAATGLGTPHFDKLLAAALS